MLILNKRLFIVCMVKLTLEKVHHQIKYQVLSVHGQHSPLTIMLYDVPELQDLSIDYYKLFVYNNSCKDSFKEKNL